MNKELTFNDLPMVVAKLRDEVVGMKQMIIGLQSQNKPHKANTHIPMSVEEASKSGKTKCARFEKRNVQKSGKTKRAKKFAHTTL